MIKERAQRLTESEDSNGSQTQDVATHSVNEGHKFFVADELKKLAELRDSGILTEGEFELQKAKLLESD